MITRYPKIAFLFFLWLVILLLISGCNGSEGEIYTQDKTSEIVSLSIGASRFDLPREDIVDVSIQASGLDSAEDDVLVSLDFDDIGISHLARQNIRTDLTIRLFRNPDRGGRLVYSRDVISAWNGSGVYEDRIIEEEDGYFRVYSSYIYPKLWHAFSVRPGVGELVDGYWLGGCRASKRSPGDEVPANARCQVLIGMDDVTVSLNYSEIYISDFNEIKTSLLNYFEARRVHKGE